MLLTSYIALPSFDFLFYLKTVFIIFAVLKCLEVLISAIRKKAHGITTNSQNPISIYLAEHLSQKSLLKQQQIEQEKGENQIRDGKIENKKQKSVEKQFERQDLRKKQRTELIVVRDVPRSASIKAEELQQQLIDDQYYKRKELSVQITAY